MFSWPSSYPGQTAAYIIIVQWCVLYVVWLQLVPTPLLTRTPDGSTASVLASHEAGPRTLVAGSATRAASWIARLTSSAASFSSIALTALSQQGSGTVDPVENWQFLTLFCLLHRVYESVVMLCDGIRLCQHVYKTQEQQEVVDGQVVLCCAQLT